MGGGAQWQTHHGQCRIPWAVGMSGGLAESLCMWVVRKWILGPGLLLHFGCCIQAMLCLPGRCSLAEVSPESL